MKKLSRVKRGRTKKDGHGRKQEEQTEEEGGTAEGEAERCGGPTKENICVIYVYKESIILIL